MINTVITAGIGAIFGAVGRYFLTNYGKKHFGTKFPYATLFINLTGALLLGLVFGLRLSSFVYALIGTGVLGGYTTFSTMNVELLTLWNNKKYLSFCCYFLSSYLGGLILVFIGLGLGKAL
ncbi:fluoride efflux transporter CrcB [Lactobacillus colini]|nr:fluoride efflux transporter CrcB [Lactobacillus colini]